MDISKPSSDKEVRVLTQDDSPQHHNENKQNQLTLRSAMDLFVLPGDMSPSAAGLFVTCAIDNAPKGKIDQHSPATKRLLERHEVIDNLADISGSEKKAMKNILSKDYVKSYTSQSRHRSFITPQLSSKAVV